MGTNYHVRTLPCDKACDHCGESQLIHLGKTSAGWCFNFQADPDWPRDDAFKRWLLLALSGPIEDEYGKPLTVGELLHRVYERHAQRSHLETPDSISDSRFICDGHDFCDREFS